ncbi:hypothetical protein [Paenibacillus alvei]|uniref:Uncharacterized protein n=1 Tax=Paenibacillus alvei TaxID=44250 RepID=A0AAP6ZXZ3_PAEAL|nr:hypothetical protein [Paenibacillus alvei]MCY9582099.1 hypothetical protein [Paenibacillus alvei]MCY9587673.1 hypothetical protein [Paenibacillus alvei]NOJ72075.1 hypothetical protein [Paenibacillus alvei]
MSKEAGFKADPSINLLAVRPQAARVTRQSASSITTADSVYSVPDGMTDTDN